MKKEKLVVDVTIEGKTWTRKLEWPSKAASFHAAHAEELLKALGMNARIRVRS